MIILHVNSLILYVTAYIAAGTEGDPTKSQQFVDQTWDFLTRIGTIASISGIGVMTIVFAIWKNRTAIATIVFQRKLKLLKKGYFTDKFLLENIEKSKERITIFSVRNVRVTEPDILDAFRKACARGVCIELYWLSPQINDYVINEIMKTLPTPPASVGEYKQQVESNKGVLCSQVLRWSNEQKSRISVYYYNTLPTIHFCRFDKKIYLGFQIFDMNDDLENGLKLGDYATIIETNSNLGRLIFQQLERLNQDNKLIKIDL